jgi:ribosome biogenesis GTPase
MYPKREHVLASNVDQLVVVASYLAPRIKWGLIDRYLVLAELQDLPAVIVLNKKDLLLDEGDEEFVKQCHERSAYYRSLGYRVIEVQANASKANKSPAMIELRDLMRDRISIFSGHSGVGKSSIVNLMAPDLEQAVEENSDIFYKGRHTTSYASFLGLGTGGYVIDTPGIRSFVVGEFNPIELSHGFKDIRELASQCKFRECRHIDEPECAVMTAVQNAKIPDWRYQHYQGILLGTTGREGRKRQHNDDVDPLIEE